MTVSLRLHRQDAGPSHSITLEYPEKEKGKETKTPSQGKRTGTRAEEEYYVRTLLDDNQHQPILLLYQTFLFFLQL